MAEPERQAAQTDGIYRLTNETISLDPRSIPPNTEKIAADAGNDKMTEREFRSTIKNSSMLAHRGAVEDALAVLDGAIRSAIADANARWVVLLSRHAAALSLPTGNHARALAYLQLALAQRPDDPMVLYMSADLYEKSGDPARAKEFFIRCAQASKVQRNEGLLELLAAKGY